MNYKNSILSRERITTIPRNLWKPDEVLSMILGLKQPIYPRQEKGEINYGPTYQRNIQYYAAIKEGN